MQNDARDQLEAVSEQFSTLQAEAIRSDAGVMRIDKELAQELKRSNRDQKRIDDLRERRVLEVARVEAFIVDNQIVRFTAELGSYNQPIGFSNTIYAGCRFGCKRTASR